MGDNRQTNDAADDHVGLSRRTTLSLMGHSGLLLGSQSATAATGTGPGPGPTGTQEHDVDFRGHSLANVGSLSMAARSQPITDFAGRNLSVGSDGVLHATSTSPFDGALVPIQNYEVGVFSPRETHFTRQHAPNPVTIPFDQLDEGFSNCFVSLSGAAVASEPDSTLSVRLVDLTSGDPLADSEVQETVSETRPTRVPVVGPQVAYDPKRNAVLGFEAKVGGGDEQVALEGATVQVWGEIK
ncbi:hypothetical protein [Saliphagus sp. LR7]|uniref:hypothetical protein n=1 Tax=Saliphagus sp. LR7 TaxID=2282654 RepID=UPI000DF7325E|nr:hypothetical protein [Saliphagus sp. LR7]